jgi:hypothetical protein
VQPATRCISAGLTLLLLWLPGTGPRSRLTRKGHIGSERMPFGEALSHPGEDVFERALSAQKQKYSGDTARSALRPSSPFPLLDAVSQTGRSFRKQAPGAQEPSRSTQAPQTNRDPKGTLSFTDRTGRLCLCCQFSGPLTLFHAAKPPSIWQADARLASWAACTAIAERSPNAQ